MWYAIKTDFRKEASARDLLLGLDGVRDVYLPVCRRTVTAESGEKRTYFMPTISGFLLANIDENKADKLINSWGYFTYKLPVYNAETGARDDKVFASCAHLLCVNAGELTKAEILTRARVPQRDVERLRIFNDRLAEGIEDLRVLDVQYETLEAENDTVLITEGPYLGIEGIIKQVKTRGRKDRRLHFSVGCFTVSVPNVRNYRHIVIREARRGEKAREVTAWRHIDQLTGLLQASPLPDKAPARLRDILRGLGRNIHLDDYTASLAPGTPQRDFLSSLTAAGTGSLISLSRYFQAYNKSIDLGLTDLIPDTTLRPFLTPTPGKAIPAGSDRTELTHDGIREVIIRTDLRPWFLTIIREGGQCRIVPASEARSKAQTKAQSETQSDDAGEYTYYAHIAIIEHDGRTWAAASWGDFIGQYIIKTTAEREAFHAELEERGYTRLAALLKECAHTDAGISSGATHIFRQCSITGFAREIISPSGGDSGRSGEEEAISGLIASIAPAAVEMWQGTRLLFWRKLAQRYVLLHKQPDEE